MVILGCQCCRRTIPVETCLVAQFLRQYRRDTGEASVDRLEDRLGLGGKRFTERIFIAGQGIQLVLGVGDEVRLAGQNLSYTADRSGYVLDAVDDSIVIVTEDQVTVLSHQLHDQRLVTQIPHLVEMLDIDMHDTL